MVSLKLILSAISVMIAAQEVEVEVEVKVRVYIDHVVRRVLIMGYLR